MVYGFGETRHFHDVKVINDIPSIILNTLFGISYSGGKLSDYIEPISNAIGKWFGPFIERRLHGKELRDGLLLKEAGTLVVSMRSLYSTFNQLLGELNLLDENSERDERRIALKKISDFSYRWELMPVVVQSLKVLKEKVTSVDEKDREAVHILIQCGEKFLKNASIDEEGRPQGGPTPWANAEVFRNLLEDTKRAETYDKMKQVQESVNKALEIFERDNIIKSDRTLGILKNNILTRYPTIPYPDF